MPIDATVFVPRGFDSMYPYSQLTTLDQFSFFATATIILSTIDLIQSSTMTARARSLLLIGCIISLSNAYTTPCSIKSPIWKHHTTGVPNHDDSGSITTLPSAVGLRAGESSADQVIHHSDGLMKELLAEFIGTFLIVQIGCGSVMSDIFGGAFSGLFQVAAVWVVAVTIAISTTSSISGAHLNPSISVALALFRGFQWTKVIPYSIAQTLGAVAASAVNLVLFADKIKAFEHAHAIVRGSTASVASARAFGEYIS
jgi:Major intrinsic protein